MAHLQIRCHVIISENVNVCSPKCICLGPLGLIGSMSYVVVPLRKPRKGLHVFWSKTIWLTDISSTQYIKILVNLSTIIAVSTKHWVGPRSASQMTWPYLCQSNIGSAKCRLAKWFSTKTLRTKIIAISVNAAIVVNGYPLLKPRPVVQNSRYLQFYVFCFFLGLCSLSNVAAPCHQVRVRWLEGLGRHPGHRPLQGVLRRVQASV